MKDKTASALLALGGLLLAFAAGLLPLGIYLMAGMLLLAGATVSLSIMVACSCAYYDGLRDGKIGGGE